MKKKWNSEIKQNIVNGAYREQRIARGTLAANIEQISDQIENASIRVKSELSECAVVSHELIRIAYKYAAVYKRTHNIRMHRLLGRLKKEPDTAEAESKTQAQTGYACIRGGI